jgi:hypothetical protein
MRTPFAQLHRPIKILDEELGTSEGSWMQAIESAIRIAKRRERPVFVDYRPRSRSVVVWDWTHHAGPMVVSVDEVTDQRGEHGHTRVSPTGTITYPHARAAGVRHAGMSRRPSREGRRRRSRSRR